MFAYCINNPVNLADTTGELPFFLLTAAIGAVAGAIIGGVAAAKNGGNVLAGIGIGAAVGGLVGAGLGAAAGAMLAGSATASTAAVISGAGIVTTAVSTGGLGAGAALIADNIVRATTYSNPVLYAGGNAALDAAQNYAAKSGGTLISDTAVGKTANYLASVLPSRSEAIWAKASTIFCKLSSGSVQAFVSDCGYSPVSSILWNYEMPALVNNPRIVEIIIEIF